MASHWEENSEKHSSSLVLLTQCKHSPRSPKGYYCPVYIMCHPSTKLTFWNVEYLTAMLFKNLQWLGTAQSGGVFPF